MRKAAEEAGDARPSPARSATRAPREDDEPDRKPRGVGAAPGPRPRGAHLPDPRADEGAPLGPAAEPTGWRAFPLFAAGRRFKALTPREGREALADLSEAIIKYGEIADDAMPWASRTHAKLAEPIWGNLDDEDADALARLFVRLGSRWGVAAQAVRGMQRTYEYAEALMITWPRFKQTFDYYAVNGFVLSWQIGGRRRARRPVAGVAQAAASEGER